MPKKGNVRLPVLLNEDFVVFPETSADIYPSAGEFYAAEHSITVNGDLLLLAYRDPDSAQDDGSDFLPYATLCHMEDFVELPIGKYKLTLNALNVVEIGNVKVDAGGCFTAETRSVLPYGNAGGTLAAKARAVRLLVREYLKAYNAPGDLAESTSAIRDTKKLVNVFASLIRQSSVMPFYQMLVETDLSKKIDMLMELAKMDLKTLSYESEIDHRVQELFDKRQREAFLSEKIRELNDELSQLYSPQPQDPFADYGQELTQESDAVGDDVEDDQMFAGPQHYDSQLFRRIKQLEAPQFVKDRLRDEFRKLTRSNPFGQDQEVVRNYIETVVSLPWAKSDECDIDIKKAKAQLDADHFGLDDVKKRILEYLAVLKLAGSDVKSPIVCLVGPPGVGKTSIAGSLAKALGRKFIRQSLGGVHDEAEIRGHRSTYVGAMPGRIISSLKKAGVNNPLFLLDEIDKMSSDYRGDPASAMLEVLDPEQNSTFVDHYIDMEFDLSKVLFIATANDAHNIPRALYDRMEIIEIDGYTNFEKKNIALDYLVAKQKKFNGIEGFDLKFSQKGLETLISSYTMESGVRELERKIGEICRKIAFESVNEPEKQRASVVITEKNISDYLGTEKYYQNKTGKNGEIGVVNGLAWTPYGGTTLEIEAIRYPGKGEVKVTGSLGDVMKESVEIAVSYVKKYLNIYREVDENIWTNSTFHLHFPEGATPKDGPSAGAAISLAVASLVSGVPVPSNLAMTGEITLRGRILKIGGLKAKIMAAKQAGIKRVFIPRENAGEYNELPEEIKSGISVKLVSNCDEILSECLSASGKKAR